MAKPEIQDANLDLVIPIYLDSAALLDLLASIEGGFIMAEKITKQASDNTSDDISGSGEFGVGGIFNIFKMNIKGNLKKEKSRKKEEKSETERYHTYGSLLNNLRQTLRERNLIKEIQEKGFENVKTSDFIEISGKFTRNPAVDTLNKMIGFTDVYSRFNPNPSSSNNPSVILEKLSSLVKDFEDDGIKKFIIKPTDYPECKVIVSLFTEYIRDRSGREIPEGEFKLLGKIIQKIPRGQKVNLIKGSFIDILPDEKLGEVSNLFKSINNNGVSLPELQFKIDSPAIEVIPISIFV